MTNRRLLTCTRCGYEWFSSRDPVKCPRCRNPYWNKERKYKLQKNKSPEEPPTGDLK